MTAVTEDLPDAMTDGFFLQYQELAAKTAFSEWKKSPVFAMDDVEQAIWEHVVGNWKYYAVADEENVGKFMTRAARGYVRKERVDYMYFTGAFVYTPKIVAAFLETCAWKPLEEVPDVDARVDVREAFEILRDKAPSQAQAVFKRYALGEELSAAEQKNVSRGVESLTHRLNSGLRLQAESIDLTTAQEL